MAPIFRTYTILLLTLSPCLLSAQINSPFYGMEAGSILQTGTQKPFWLISNQHGKYHPENSSLFAGLYLGSDVKQWEVDSFWGEQADTTKEFKVDYGLEAFNRFNGEYDIRLNQYYLDLSYWYGNIHVGAREESFGNQFDPLSSGSLLYSGNARPIPKIAVSSDYIPVPFSQGYIEFRGYLSHGWFEKERYTEQPYLHHKNVYVRVGGDLPVHAHYGFHHYAMWGGVSPEYGDIGSDRDSYIKMFLVKQGDSIQNEALNAYGNHLGSRNFGLDYEAGDYAISVYYQTIFEDNSGKAWRNIRDGFWGAVYRKKEEKPLLKNICYEFIHTKDQSGRHHQIGDSIVGGNDNYFNNYLYSSGWTHHSYTIGTPLITSPVMNDNGSIRMQNNRLIAHHLGLNGWLNEKMYYKTLLTYSINYGTNASPYQPARKDVSFLVELNYLLSEENNLLLKGKLAGDLGEMYGKNFGVFLSVVKTGRF